MGLTRYFNLNYYLVALLVFTLLLGGQILPTKALAFDDLDQTCSNGVANSPQYSFLSHDPAQVFVPTKGTLDAVGVYVKSEIGNTSNITIKVINATTAPGITIASATQMITNTPRWVYFDFSDVAMPLGIYAITLQDADANSHAIWYEGNAGCYDRGYAFINGVMEENIDLGFAVYAYDTGGSTPSDQTGTSGQSGTSGTSGSSTGSSAATSNKSSGSSSTSSKYKIPSSGSFTPPSDEVLRALSASDDSFSPGGTLIGGILFAVFIFGLIFLIIVGMIIFFIIMRRRANKSSSPAPPKK